MIEFLASIIDCKGNLPMIGDADDGFVVRMSQDPGFDPYQSIINTGALLFKRDDLLKPEQEIDDKTLWLICDSIDLIKTEGKRVDEKVKAFGNSGYFILGDELGNENEIRCMIDCGPLGYLSIAAHGHADALSIYLSVSGTEFLIDPGTFCYHTQEKWREYFRGTSAHNTVRIDRVNQSITGGNFMWLHKANAKMLNFNTTNVEETFEGQHDGYLRLKDRVMHYRKIIFRKRKRIFYIKDTIVCKKEHFVERFWHFQENCKVQIHDKTIMAENNGLKIKLSTVQNAQIDLFTGNKSLPLGWVSRHYDLKVPSYTAVMQNTIIGTAILETEICV